MLVIGNDSISLYLSPKTPFLHSDFPDPVVVRSGPIGRVTPLRVPLPLPAYLGK